MMKSKALIAIMGFALDGVSAGQAQTTPSNQAPNRGQPVQLRTRPLVTVPRPPVQPSDAAVVRPLSIFQVAPAQMSTAPRPLAGQRQSAYSLVPENGPLERVNGRIETRVQLRVLNRLDKSGETPPIISPFATAADRARLALAKRK